MPQFITDLYQPFFKFVDTDQYSVNAKFQKDKDVIQDLINRGVLSAAQERKIDYRTFTVREKPIDKLLKVMRYHDCNKMYIGEFEFMEMMQDTGQYRMYDKTKTLTMFGCEVITVPWLQGIVPVKER